MKAQAVVFTDKRKVRFLDVEVPEPQCDQVLRSVGADVSGLAPGDRVFAS